MAGSFLSMLNSLAMLNVANPNAPALTPNAPFTPNFFIDKNTDTTRTFKGIPKRFIITPRCESGMYLLLKVPMEGKYIPTQASNRKKLEIKSAEGTPNGHLVAATAPPIAKVATASIESVLFSVETLLSDSAPNKVDPNRQHAMKQLNILPYGVATSDPKIRPMAADMAGGHCSTNMYMAASKSACTAPTRAIRESFLTTSTASMMPIFLTLPSSSTSDEATFSFHVKAARSDPSARKTTLSSKAPVGPPRLVAAMEASWPAVMATRESPA
mmetsp:Transcript_22781/g.52204  ORF Transcript_22781/g.52204 Transcript_22781/m.52204 type:complete len:271 (-) Transcript_22781:881-1693(-)